MNSPIAEPVRLHVPKSAVEHRTITADEAGQRIDNFLMRHFKTVPRSRVYRLLRKGEVRVNRKRALAEYRLAAGDELRLPPVRIDAGDQPVRPSTSLLELIEAAVIFQDKHLLVLDKPAGVAVHGGSGMSYGIIEALRASRPRETLELVHRLDRDTSGCLLVARDRATLTALHALIRHGGMHKTYLALVSGSWQLGTKRIDAPLATDNRQHGERHVRVAPAGKDSVSVFKPVQFFGSLATLMEVDIPTGRTHQIRVHASFAGHPLLGDDKYGDRERNAELKLHGLKRTFLHAQAVAFEWPGTGMPFHVSAPLPAELSAVLDAITPMKRKTPKAAARGATAPKRTQQPAPTEAQQGAQKGAWKGATRAAPTSASRGAPTSASRGAPTSASRGAPTTASRGAPTTASRGAPTTASRGAPTRAPKATPVRLKVTPIVAGKKAAARAPSSSR
jgi:23S rRNA pseudouridine955/2504/2580 synthase